MFDLLLVFQFFIPLRDAYIKYI